MSSQLEFLLHQAIHYIESGNLSGSELLLNQIIKRKPDHFEALRFLAIVASQQGEQELALERIQKSLNLNKRNGIAWSNKGNILLALGRADEAVDAYKTAIYYSPNYADAHSNLGNALQFSLSYEEAIDALESAIKLDPQNSDFMVNLGNLYLRINSVDNASLAYERAIDLNPSNARAHFYLSLAYFYLGNYRSGWIEYEWRWISKEIDSIPINTSKPLWQGAAFEGSLLVWSEQGIGDQILYASIFKELEKLPQKLIIAVDKKLLNIFRRSFPGIQFLDRNESILENLYDQHIPFGSLGKFFRNNIDDFLESKNNYLVASDNNVGISDFFAKLDSNKRKCGLSWKSINKAIGGKKSMSLITLSEILKLPNFEFINLQYGDVSEDIAEIHSSLGVMVKSAEKIDLYEDIDAALNLIDVCDIIITTSNSVAHLAGALGKDVFLLLPFSVGRIWYWHEIDGKSLWYRSVRIFKQEKQGDWSKPVEATKAYLENRFAS